LMAVSCSIVDVLPGGAHSRQFLSDGLLACFNPKGSKTSTCAGIQGLIFVDQIKFRLMKCPRAAANRLPISRQAAPMVIWASDSYRNHATNQKK